MQTKSNRYYTLLVVSLINKITYIDFIAQVDSQLLAAQGGAASFNEMITQYGGTALSSTSSYGSSASQQSLVGAYGQRGRVGTEQLVELLQRQHSVFLQVAARVAETHEYCDRYDESRNICRITTHAFWCGDMQHERNVFAVQSSIWRG
jgi:hypothetical protein